MILHSIERYEERFGNLLVTVPGNKQPEHPLFLWRKGLNERTLS